MSVRCPRDPATPTRRPQGSEIWVRNHLTRRENLILPSRQTFRLPRSVLPTYGPQPKDAIHGRVERGYARLQLVHANA